MMDFLEYIKKEKKKINEKYLRRFYDKIIYSESEPDIQKVLKSSKEFILAGGRRLLPICLIQIFQGLSSEKDLIQFSEEIYEVSLSIEMLHVSSLIIEDIVDEESHRGKHKNVQYLIEKLLKEEFPRKAKIGKRKISNVSSATTIYEGNIISLIGSQIISNSNFLNERIRKALKIYQKGLIDISRGRLLNEYYKLMDLDKISLENYLILAGLKRGSQRATAAGLGATFGNARKSQWKPLMEAMNKIGIIEQLINDKNGIEEDIKSGQASMLPIIAFQSATPEQKELLKKSLGNPEISQGTVERIKGIYNSTGAIEFIHHYANSLKNDAYNKLQSVYPGLRQETMDFYENFLTYIISYNPNEK